MGNNCWKKMLCILWSTVLAVTALSGCGAKTEDAAESENAVSQDLYTEKEIPLPDSVREGNVTIVGFEQNNDQNFELFLYDQSEGQFRKYELSGDGQWNEVPCDWLNSIQEEIQSGLTQVKYRDGCYYAVYGETSGRFHLIISTDEINAAEIDMQGWHKAENEDHYPVVSKIAVLSKDTVAATLSDGTCQIHRNGELIGSFNGGEVYVLSGYGKYAARYNDGNTGIYLYNVEQKEIEKEILLTKQYQNVPQIFMNGENRIFLVGDLGILEIDRESEKCVTVVAAEQTMLSNAAYFPLWFEEKDGTIYILFTNRDQTSGRLVLYQRGGGNDSPSYQQGDENDSASYRQGDGNDNASFVSTDGSQLTIYGLYDNELIRTAVSEFRLKHPDIDIIYETAESAEGAVTESDLVRTLNARIAAGSGPDIFVLDGLPMDSYVDRGILEDLSGMLSETDVIPNIQTAYESGGEIYAVPARVGLPVIIGTQDVMNRSSSLSSLADYASQAEPPYFVEGSESYETVIESFLPFYINSIVNENRINQDKLGMFLEDMKKISDSVNAVEITDFDSSHSPRRLAYGQVSLSVCTMKGMIDDEATEMIAFAKLKGDYAVYQNLFEPYGLLGVYKASGQKELAIEFVKTALSYEVQETEYRHGGFPVSLSALEKWRDTDSERGGATGDPDTGIQINYKWPDAASRNRLYEEILSLKTPVVCDQVVRQRLEASAVAYLKGEITLEAAVQEIANEADLYLQE